MGSRGPGAPSRPAENEASLLGRFASAANFGNASVIGKSWMALAASATTSGSLSSRKADTSGRARRRSARTAAMRTPAEVSLVKLANRAGSAQPRSPITPA